MTVPVLIGLDWGTTAFRAFLLDAQGTVLERHDEPLGILKVPGGDFSAAFTAATAGWFDAFPGLPALACGMIGSRQGWVEAPYCPCPAGPAELGARLARAETRDGRALWIVPGVSRDEPGAPPDVMRGEETQIAGVIAGDRRDGFFVMPGTHSKWVELQDGRIRWFGTFMTGELFALLCEHGILGRLMAGAPDDASGFAEGLGAADGPLLHRLFSARTLGLFERLPPTALRGYLSGLLIGAEILQARALLAARGLPPDQATVIGDAALADRYVAALRHFGLGAEPAPATVTSDGLLAVARAAGLIGR